MNIPTIAGVRGTFEIFIPGVFLLINVLGFVYLFPYTDDETKKLLVAYSSSPVPNVLITVVFGYLIGVLLRLLKASVPDRCSAWYLRQTRRFRVKGRKTSSVYVTEPFPYIAAIGIMCKRSLPTDAQKFYEAVWKDRCQQDDIGGQKRGNRLFFNYCKMLVVSNDEKIATEIYIAEALSRYIAEMFYALILAFVLIFATMCFRKYARGRVETGLLFVLVAYTLAIIGILANFRYIRIKEVQTVFAASFKNRALFETENKASLI